MKHLTKSLLVIIVCAGSILSQKTKDQIVRQYVEVPREIIIQGIANQPGSPIKFENVKFLAGVNGGSTNCYNLRNVGTKPIVSVTVYSSNRAENTYGFSKSGKILMQPGEMMSESVSNIKNEIVPLTDDLRTKLNLNGKLKGIMMLMVVNVEFADGTTFSDETTRKALEKYNFEVSDALEFQEQKQKP